MFNRKSIVVLFIDRNRFHFYGGTLTGVVTLDVPETQLRDLDIVNVDTFYTLIKQWVKTNTIVDSQLVVIFSDTSYFEKVFSDLDSVQLETDVIKFFDSVPFESTLTRVYEVEKGKHAVAVNKSLYEAIRQGFSLQGIQTRVLLPEFVLEPGGAKRIFNKELGEYVIKNLDSLLHQSILDTQDRIFDISHEKGYEKNSQKKKSSLPLLLGVFGFLIIILIVMVILFRQ